jgi:hypothetical protein
MNYAETLFFKDSTTIQEWHNIFYAETAFFELGAEVCGRGNHLPERFRPLEVCHYTVLLGVIKTPGFSKQSTGKVALVGQPGRSEISESTFKIFLSKLRLRF